MQRMLSFFRLLFAVSSIVALSAHAQTNDMQRGADDAQGWLSRLQSAAQKLNYSGTFVYQQGTQMRTSRITHVADGKKELEKLEVLDGKPREYIRTGEEVLYYMPDTKTVLVERPVSKDLFPAMLTANAAELASYYRIEKGESGRVAGMDCQVIRLLPKDRFRYGYKFWAERSSGLLMRAQTLDEQNAVLEQISFTQVRIGNTERLASRLSPPVMQGWHVEQVVNQPVASGWSVQNLPAGFRKIHEVRRRVSNAGADASAAENARETIQMVYSDGLAAISVFVEPGSQSRTEGSLQQGALNIIGKRQGEFWLTIVGEVPAVSVRQVANSIEFKPK